MTMMLSECLIFHIQQYTQTFFFFDLVARIRAWLDSANDYIEGPELYSRADILNEWMSLGCLFFLALMFCDTILDLAFLLIAGVVVGLRERVCAFCV